MSMPGFLGKKYYCDTCKKSYTRRDKHKCPSKCLSCFKSNSNCKGSEWTFNTINEFCNFVFQKQHKNYTFIAHNAKSFDAQFVLRYCVLNGIKPFCIYNGTKIM